MDVANKLHQAEPQGDSTQYDEAQLDHCEMVNTGCPVSARSAKRILNSTKVNNKDLTPYFTLSLHNALITEFKT